MWEKQIAKQIKAEYFIMRHFPILFDVFLLFSFYEPHKY